MDFTKEQKREAFSKLGPAVKDFVLSEEFTDIVNKIGKDNGLLIDKVGLLENEALLAAYGLKPAASFVGNIQARLGLSSDQAAKIGAEVNQTIFLRIRQILQQPAEPVSAPAPQAAPSYQPAPAAAPAPQPAPAPAAAYSAPRPVSAGYVPVGMQDMPQAPMPAPASRDAILDEIENPSPVEHPISVAAPLPAFPRAMEVIEAPKEEKMAAAKEFVVSKLSETVASPAQQAAIDPDKFAQKPKGYQVDPYRESIS